MIVGTNFVPTEMRRILFTNDEVMNAINFFKSPLLPRLTEGVITKIVLDPEDKNVILINFKSFNKEDEKIFKFPLANMAAILINYCIHLKIPMARKASKEIRIIDGKIVLELTLAP